MESFSRERNWLLIKINWLFYTGTQSKDFKNVDCQCCEAEWREKKGDRRRDKRYPSLGEGDWKSLTAVCPFPSLSLFRGAFASKNPPKCVRPLESRGVKLWKGQRKMYGYTARHYCIVALFELKTCSIITYFKRIVSQYFPSHTFHQLFPCVWGAVPIATHKNLQKRHH